MLQIISGKFFESDERYSFDAFSVLYSNYQWIDDIKTCIASLKPDASMFGKQPTYILKYRNQIEKGPVLIRTGDDVIVQQFEAICIFGLKAMFDVQRSNIEAYCQPKSKEAIHRPSISIPRFFDPNIMGNLNEVQKFSKFVKKVIGLPRGDYNVIIKCLLAYSHSLKILDYNFNLAYSLLIFCLESLTQNFDKYQPKWEDYPEHIQLDRILSDIDSVKRSEIKQTILKNRNLKSQKRFVQFTLNHISESFFTDESQNIKFATRKSEIEQALINAYQMRSSYAHELEPIFRNLSFAPISKGDVYHFENNPYLTYAGLLRLTSHVISNFLAKQRIIEKEKFPWRDELPHVYQMEADPHYWIWNHENFDKSLINRKLSGFLTQFVNFIVYNGMITDCTNLMALYETLIPNLRQENRIPLEVHYCLYNLLLASEKRSQNFHSVGEKIQKLGDLDICNIENIVFLLILRKRLKWSADQCIEQYKKYQKKKFKKNSLYLPQMLEVIVLIAIANEYFYYGYYSEYSFWIDYSYQEASGTKKIQDFMWKYLSIGDLIEVDLLFTEIKPVHNNEPQNELS